MSLFSWMLRLFSNTKWKSHLMFIAQSHNVQYKWLPGVYLQDLIFSLCLIPWSWSIRYFPWNVDNGGQRGCLKSFRKSAGPQGRALITQFGKEGCRSLALLAPSCVLTGVMVAQAEAERGCRVCTGGGSSDNPRG